MLGIATATLIAFDITGIPPLASAHWSCSLLCGRLGRWSSSLGGHAFDRLCDVLVDCLDSKLLLLAKASFRSYRSNKFHRWYRRSILAVGAFMMCTGAMVSIGDPFAGFTIITLTNAALFASYGVNGLFDTENRKVVPTSSLLIVTDNFLTYDLPFVQAGCAIKRDALP